MSDVDESETSRLPPFLRMDWDKAIHEYELYKRHGRPSRPIYMKCLVCEDAWEIGNSLRDADHDARYHAGVHGGLEERDAQIIITDSTGRELFRHHAFNAPEHFVEDPACEVCDWPLEDDRVSCRHCGAIPEEARL